MKILHSLPLSLNEPIPVLSTNHAAEYVQLHSHMLTLMGYKSSYVTKCTMTVVRWTLFLCSCRQERSTPVAKDQPKRLALTFKFQDRCRKNFSWPERILLSAKITSLIAKRGLFLVFLSGSAPNVCSISDSLCCCCMHVCQK